MLRDFLSSEQRRDDLRHAARLCYENIPARQTEPFADYLARVVWTYKGVVFTRDVTEPGLWWVDVVSDAFYISPRTGRVMARICCDLGCEYLAANTEQAPEMARFWRTMGFEKKGAFLWTAKLSR